MELPHLAHPVEHQPHLGQQQLHLLVQPRAAAQRHEGPVEVLVRAGDAVPVGRARRGAALVDRRPHRRATALGPHASPSRTAAVSMSLRTR